MLNQLTKLHFVVMTAVMCDPYFFGYGSLVNLSTHDYADPRAASLKGWRRMWLNTYMRGAAFLSVHPAVHQEIKGVVARVPKANWYDLDLRETGYSRHNVSEFVEVEASQPSSCSVYVADLTKETDSKQKSPILMSYLDVVLQGFFQIYGETGLDHFLESTDGWDRPIQNDRAKPIYPRNRELSAFETELIDYKISERSFKII